MFKLPPLAHAAAVTAFVDELNSSVAAVVGGTLPPAIKAPAEVPAFPLGLSLAVPKSAVSVQAVPL